MRNPPVPLGVAARGCVMELPPKLSPAGSQAAPRKCTMKTFTDPEGNQFCSCAQHLQPVTEKDLYPKGFQTPSRIPPGSSS